MASKIALALMCGALVLSGCSSDPAPAAKAKPTATLQPGSLASLLANHPSATPSPGSKASPASSPSLSPTTSPARSGTPRTTAPAATHSPTPKPSPRQVKLTLAFKPCVQRGQKQTVSFHLNPHMGVVLDTGYADGKDGQVYGGFDYGHYTDARGNYTLSWIVNPAAPLGTADTLVGAVDRSTQANGRATWRVALTC